jgi:hypothetical protein
MKPLLNIAALAALLTVAVLDHAQARWGGGGGAWHSQTSYSRVGPGQWTRSGSVTGPRGNSASFAGSTSCAGGTCNRATTYTGPNGREVTASGSVARTAPGQFSSSGTVTGPRGGTASHSATTDCAGGTCTRTGSITGANGTTYSTANTVTRTVPGQFSSSGSITGPNGGTLEHSGATACADGSCNHTGTYYRE